MKKGFTLIELLVVIAIIAILAAILFPVFAQAREKARAASCLSNCKELATALLLYVDDYDETVPIIFNRTIDTTNVDASYPCKQGFGWLMYGLGDSEGNPWSWRDMIFPYVKNLGVYICPSGYKKVPGYGYNNGLCVNGATANLWESWNQYNPGLLRPVCLAEIDNTSKLVFCCDGCQRGGDSSQCYQCPFTLLLKYDNPAVFQSWGVSDPIRHNGGANFAFSDGHAKYYKLYQGPLNVICWYDSATVWWTPGATLESDR
ncbi:MAG: prepilin-type N-terminal cleavage/methylation domain-containing protein [Abditibacteriota bacterium]|nr:prepilin-type N-terminal cleavage/methylation domain-containing protein [Abditibacteriota bacterium]